MLVCWPALLYIKRIVTSTRFSCEVTLLPCPSSKPTAIFILGAAEGRNMQCRVFCEDNRPHSMQWLNLKAHESNNK